MVFMTLTRVFSVAVMTLLCVLALSVVAKADTITFTAVLNGANEVPSRNTTATGTATLVLDTATGRAVLSVSFSGLTSGLTGAHIHCCALPTANAGVLQGFDSQLTIGATSGSFTNWTLPITLTAQQMADLRNGLMYVNIHTSNFTGGEIRGQLYAVPEPGTLLLLGAGLLSLAGALRKRRDQD
jgi:hypothetical protein